ncbi:MAG: ABC transporter ATP-binding protein/permease [Clostridia bacterium]|nr:ABC transporter ATP-binding protein/permease [Clostridia bacterium]
MKKLLTYLKPYRRESVLGPLFKLLEASFELIVPLVVAAIIDTGIRGGAGTGYVIRMALILVLLGFVGLVCSVTAQFFAAKAAVGFTTRLRSALFSHIQTLSYQTIDSVGTSTLITRITSDLNQVQSGLNLTLRLLLRSPFVVFGAMIMAFTVDAQSALWFVAAIPVLSVVGCGVMLISIPLYRRVQSHLDALLGRSRENMTGVRVLRAFGKEEEEVKGFAEQNDRLTAMQKKVGRFSALMNPVTYVIINLAIIALIHTGALRVEAGIITQGAVVALYNYMSQILVELIKMANLIISITKAVACANRISAVLELPSEPAPADQPSSSASKDCRVSFVNASLRYEGAGAESVEGITLDARPGETIGVIGGTGSGKTTLVNLIPRFYEATGGSVLVNGKDVRSWDTSSLRQKIGLVPQKAVLFSGTVKDNLLWGNSEAAEADIALALETAQASEIVEKKGGLSAMVEAGGRNLSGGQRQRLTIARALVRKPEILILDDSSSALDFATDAALRRALRSLPWHPTVFIVSQRTSSIMHADRIIVLEDGKAAGIGTHAQLLESCAVYREIYNSQFRKEDARA